METGFLSMIFIEKKKKNRAFPTYLEKTKFGEIIGCSEQQEQPKLTFI